MATHILITDDGKFIPFDPKDYTYIVNQRDLEAGVYDMKFEREPPKEGDEDIIRGRLTQLVPPLVKVR